MSRYGPRKRTRLGKVGRFFLWLLVVILMIIGALLGGFWLWINESVSAVQAHSPETKEAEKALDVPLPGQPAVAMVLGYDKRAGEAKSDPSRSDTIMLIRVDPKQKVVSMLSFPRDLYVDIPGCKRHLPFSGRINEAYAECGPRGTLETVKKLTGIPINYLLSVNFHGFKEIVDKVGGVYMDIDRRYFNDNSGYGEKYSKINLHPGYQKLNGAQALTFVRYRHTDSDLYRNARQQEFVKAIKQQISGFSSVSKIPGIVSTITHNVEVGVGGGKTLDVGTVYGYAKLLFELKAGSFQQSRLQGLTEIPGTFELQATPESMQSAVQQFLNPDSSAPEKAAAAATGTKPKKSQNQDHGPPPSEVSVEVLNGNGVAGSADEAGYLLAQRGYQTTNGGNAPTFDFFRTGILYNQSEPDAEAAANDLAKLFSDAKVEPAPANLNLTTTVQVIVGQTFHGALAPLPQDQTPKHEKPDVSPDTTTRSQILPLRPKLGFPVLVPTVTESGAHVSTLEGVRAYRLNGEGALRITYESPDNIEYWGIQEAAWTDAPILNGASVIRTIAGRQYKLFFSGAHLHLVAFEENGAAYWVTNTLLDSMSNETMLAIAKGLRPPHK